MPIILAKPPATEQALASTTTSRTAEADTSFNGFQAVNIAAFILNTAITYGIGTLGWTGQLTNQELSKKYQTLVTPIPWAFVIWAPIFILQLIWVLWQLLPKQRNAEAVYATGYRYAIVAILQVGWTLSFAYEVIWLSLVFMLCLWVALVDLVVQLQKVEKHMIGYFLWQFPFSLYAGWITAASFVNLNVVLVAYGASAAAQLVVASLSVVGILALSLLFLALDPADLTLPLVLVWALGGLYAQLKQAPESLTEVFTGRQLAGLQIGAMTVAGVILACTLIKIVVEVKNRLANEESPASSEEESEEQV